MTTFSEATTTRADPAHPGPDGQPVEGEHPLPTSREPGAGSGPEAGAEPSVQPVAVRRSAVASGVIGAGAAGMATAYLWRAVGTGGTLDWVVCALLAVLAMGFLRSLLDSRTPLLVVDELGVRARLGADWRGVPWEAVDRVVVTPRSGLVRDGRLVVTLLDPVRATAGLEGRALRHAQLNKRMYGAALAAPLGMTTRVSGEGELADRVAALSRGRTDVVTLLDAPGQVLRPVEEPAAPAPQPDPSGRPPSGRPPSGHTGDEPTGEDADSGRETRRRRRTAPFRVVDAGDVVTARIQPAEEGERVEPIETVVIEEPRPQPAPYPVIGPELAAARARVGLSVDELAERTRIRPHVIESIEVDDFVPCGGDFYARGHIRTLSRVLGKDPVPLLGAFEHRYATAPVSARKVFEAELATGITGTVRGGGLGGPNWALLVGVAVALVLVWSGVRLFAGGGEDVLETPPPLLGSTAELAGGFAGAEEEPLLPLTLTASGAGARVEVHDGAGELVFEGDLRLGDSKDVRGVAPLTVSSDDGGAVTVTLDGRSVGAVGKEGVAATRVIQAPPS